MHEYTNIQLTAIFCHSFSWKYTSNRQLPFQRYIPNYIPQRRLSGRSNDCSGLSKSPSAVRNNMLGALRNSLRMMDLEDLIDGRPPLKALHLTCIHWLLHVFLKLLGTVISEVAIATAQCRTLQSQVQLACMISLRMKVVQCKRQVKRKAMLMASEGTFGHSEPAILSSATDHLRNM